MKFSQLKEILESRKEEWKTKLSVFSFFLAISLVIWLLNALSKNYTTEIEYPITYNRFPQGKILVNDLPNHLTLRVNAHGYALMSYKLINRPVPINFSVSAYAMNRIAGDSSRFYLLTNYAREQVSRQLSSELQLLEIFPDSLIFQFANLTEAYLPVDLQINYTIDKQFTLTHKVEIDPDSVLVTGPDIYLDTLDRIPTEMKSLGILDKSYSGKVRLDRYPQVRYDADEVNIEIELEKLTEIQLEVPVHVSGLPDSLRMQTFPQFVRVSGRVGLSRYERIVPEAFLAEIEYSQVLSDKSRLQVQLKTIPEGLTGVSYYPQSVEYLLSVKE